MHLARITMRRKEFFREKTAMNTKKEWWGLTSFKLSTDPVSVEATTEWLNSSPTTKSKLSTDPASVEATTEWLLNESHGLFARRFSFTVAAPTDAGSVESDQFHLSSLGLAFQSLLPPTRGRWRAISDNPFCSSLVILPLKYRSWRCLITPCLTLTSF